MDAHCNWRKAGGRGVEEIASISMTKKTTGRVAKTPTTELPALWEAGFLREWRTATEIAAEFAKKGCHFASSAVGNALARADYVTRRGKGKGVGIKYIQSYPFEKE